MAKKNIVILGTAFPYRGGLAAYNERLAKAFIEAGHSVEIYTFTLQYPSFLFPGTSQFSEGAAPIDLVIHRKVNSINPFNWIKVGYELYKKSPDILLIKFWLPFMAPCFGTIAHIAKRNKNTKIISILDNVIPHEKRIGDMQFIQYFVRAVDACIAMSDSVLMDWKKFNTTKPALLRPHPIYDNFGLAISKSEARGILKLKTDDKIVLFFGFIRDYKGLDLLIEAMADNRIRALDIKCLVAGEFYTDAAPYHELIKKNDVENSILLHTDFIPDEAVKNYFCAADLIVQPYKHATQSGVTQIGYHFEKPMLVTDVGGLAEIIPHNQAGYVVPVSPLDIADAIADFYQNYREEKMVEFVKNEKKKYAWDVMVEAVESL
jgi:glycosyltransferase involved in cell wall biosynthesis